MCISQEDHCGIFLDQIFVVVLYIVLFWTSPWWCCLCGLPCCFLGVCQKVTKFQIVIATLSLFVMALSVLTLNCNGIRDQSKWIGLVQWLHSLPTNVDVVCLQETHCVPLTWCLSWFSSSSFSFVFSPGSVHSCGCMVLFRPSLSLANSWCDADGQFVNVIFLFSGSLFVLLCLSP